MNQLTIACCQRLLCDCESLIRLYETRFIVWPPFVQCCHIWSLQSNPPLISGCSVISHRQYVLKSNEEATSSQSYKIRGIAADSEAHQRQREIDYFYPFVLLPNSLLHKCVCVPSIKQEREKKVIEPARRNAAGTGKKRFCLNMKSCIHKFTFWCKIWAKCTFYPLCCSSATAVIPSLSLATADSLDAGKANLCDVPGVKEQVVMNTHH